MMLIITSDKEKVRVGLHVTFFIFSENITIRHFWERKLRDKRGKNYRGNEGTNVAMERERESGEWLRNQNGQ